MGPRLRTGELSLATNPTMSKTQAATLPSPTQRVALQVGLAALVLAALFQASVESSGRSRSVVVNDALVHGADRLVSLQRADGLWPAMLQGPGDVASSGRSARALLAAWRTTRDARYLAAARRAADAIIPRLTRDERVPSLGNMMLVAELGEITGDPRLGEIAHSAWARTFTVAERVDGSLAAHGLMSRRNSTAWLDGAWNNYLLGRAADQVELARLIGETEWADAFAVTAASSWAPKRDHDFWASATSGMTLALAGSQSTEGRRLLEVELSILRGDELSAGLVWSDSPYDSYVYASESADVLRGLVASDDRDARQAASEAALLIAARQASHGGWGEVLSLFDQVADQGSADAPAAELAAGETPELDAAVVLALAELLRAPITPISAS